VEEQLKRDRIPRISGKSSDSGHAESGPGNNENTGPLSQKQEASVLEGAQRNLSLFHDFPLMLFL
jgi:hypothetical protein